MFQTSAVLDAGTSYLFRLASLTRASQKLRNSAHYTLNSTSWANVDTTNLDITLPAKTDDRIAVDLSAL